MSSRCSATARSCSPAGAAGGWLSRNCACCSHAAVSPACRIDSGPASGDWRVRISFWVSDVTYVATWGGFTYVAFVIDIFARRIVGWRVSASMRTDFVLDALEAGHLRAPRRRADRPLVHHTDRGTRPGSRGRRNTSSLVLE